MGDILRPDVPQLMRMVESAHFEQMLTTPTRSRSAHLAVHHLLAAPSSLPMPQRWKVDTDLSTGPAPTCPQPVDDLLGRQWLGLVVPKRHARRSVTRSLIKRQIRGAFQRNAHSLPAGQWLVRLRAPFAKTEFVSASSTRLAHAARVELDQLLARAAR